jgi:hypothetical protein
MKRTISRVSWRSIWHQDLKETSSLNSQVKRIICIHQIALRKQALGSNYSGTRAHLKTRWQDSVLRRLGSNLTDILIEQVLKNCPSTLEAVRSNVRQIIGDRCHLGLLGIEARFRNPQ